MKLAIDLRGLNFAPRTGINTYTLHLVYKLIELAEAKDIVIVGIGLNPKVLQELSSEFSFLSKIKHLSLQKYLKLPVIFSQRVIVAFSYLKLSLGLNLENSKYEKFDCLILPQPRFLPKNPHTKIITCFHDIFALLDSSSLPRLQSILDNHRVYKQILNFSDKVVINSIATGQDLHRVFKIEKTKLVLAYPSLPEWQTLTSKRLLENKVQVETPKKYFLAISGIEKRKNWQTLILAHHHLNLSEPKYNLHLVLAGVVLDKNFYSYLINLVKEKDIKNVHFFLSPQENLKQTLLEKCEFLAYPSFYEGFGFPILEAFKYGKAVLTSSLGSMPEVTQKAGLYIDPTNMNDVARGIFILSQDLKFRAKLEKESSFYSAQFSWDTFGQVFLDIFHKLLTKPRA